MDSASEWKRSAGALERKDACWLRVTSLFSKRRGVYVHFINGNFKPSVCFSLSNASFGGKIFPDRKNRRDTRPSLCYHSSPSESGWKISLCAPRQFKIRNAASGVEISRRFVYVFSSRGARSLFSARTAQCHRNSFQYIYKWSSGEKERNISERDEKDHQQSVVTSPFYCCIPE